MKKLFLFTLSYIWALSVAAESASFEKPMTDEEYRSLKASMGDPRENLSFGFGSGTQWKEGDGLSILLIPEAEYLFLEGHYEYTKDGVVHRLSASTSLTCSIPIYFDMYDKALTSDILKNIEEGMSNVFTNQHIEYGCGVKIAFNKRALTGIPVVDNDQGHSYVKFSAFQVEELSGDDGDSYEDGTKGYAIGLGMTPWIELDESIEFTYKWYKEKDGSSKAIMANILVDW